MNRIARQCGVFFALLFLLGCESTPRLLLTYGAQGTVIQAERLIGKLLEKEVLPLPYGGLNVGLQVDRMQARFPTLRPWLDRGVVGLTDDGDLAIRDPDSAPFDLSRLVREENLDRAVFYYGMCGAVGHGGDSLRGWLPYVRETFGTEWSRQAPSGWWLRDQRGVWLKKQ